MAKTTAAQQDSGNRLPLTLDEITAEWLTSALQPHAPGVVVDRCAVRSAIWGTATKVFVEIEARNAEAYGVPANLVVKGGFEERLRQYGAGTAYELEARFYRDLASALEVDLPKAYYAGAETGRQGVVILEDLNDKQVSFGDPRDPWPPDRVAEGLTSLAKLHAKSWGTRPGRFEWLQAGSPVFRVPTEYLFSTAQFNELSSRPGMPNLEGKLAENRLILSAYQNLWAHDDASTQVVCHGDAHVGQTYVHLDGRVDFLDWQGVMLAPWADDVAYFIISALTVENRRAYERDLLTEYLAVLRSFGGPVIAESEAWLEYRRHALHGLVWQVTPDAMQHLDVVTAMATRYVEAINDLDTLAANDV